MLNKFPKTGASSNSSVSLGQSFALLDRGQTRRTDPLPYTINPDPDPNPMDLILYIIISYGIIL